MVSDKIRWCMRCNLIVTSRRCPCCRNDVSHVKLIDGAELSPIFQNQASAIRSMTDKKFGDGCGNLLIPDDRTAFFENVGGRKYILINGGIVGHIGISGKLHLNPTGLSLISGNITRSYIRCDHDSSYFVTKGRSLMVTGIKERSEGLSKGDTVAVFNDRGVPVAEGVMKMSAEEIAKETRGVAVGIKDYSTPRIHTDKKHNNWLKTIDENSHIMGSTIGETVKNIKLMKSSYKFQVVVQLGTDIVSEANLLLTLDAGIKPSVLLEKRDDFIDYMLDKLKLKIVDRIPDKCVLITENTDISKTDVIVHSPTSDWDPSMVWLYVMQKAEPFSPSYMQRI